MTCYALMTYALIELARPRRINKPIARYICHYSKKYNVDPRIILAVAWHESRARQNTGINSTHDSGIMQLHCPEEHTPMWCTQCDIKQLWCNIRQGVKILRAAKRYHKRNCGDQSPHHWVQHYNWYSKGYWKRVMGIVQEIQLYEEYLIDE